MNLIHAWASVLPNAQCPTPHEIHFGDPQAETAAALRGTVIVPLAHAGLIEAHGADVETFLQGQLSNDIRELSPVRAQLSSFNSPKGRMLAVLHLFRDDGGIFLEIHRSILETTLKRLRMFVLRSKVQLEDLSVRRVAFGLAGPQAASVLARLDLPVPGKALDAAWSNEVCVIRRQSHRDDSPRFSLHAPAEIAAALWSKLTAHANPVGTQAWSLLDILAGIPAVYPETSDHFVPQMCNLDGLGGISFNKGCYTGQEIVARVHYRGAVKRRMVQVRLPQDPPVPGTKLEQGEVVDAARHPEGGCIALVVSSTV